MPTDQPDSEQEIERLVRELGQVVRSADPEKQNQLKEFAATLVNQEMAPGPSVRATQSAVRRPMNPLAAGLGLLVLGAGFFFFFPPMGIVFGLIGLVAIVWGAVISFIKR